MRFILPIIFIVIAGGLFFGLTTGLFAEVDTLRLEKDKVEQNLDDALSVQQKFKELQEAASLIKPSDKARLAEILPPDVDTVDLLYKIDRLAKQSSMALAGAKISIDGASKNAKRQTAIVPGLGTVTFNFSVSGTYGALKEFLDSLEKSLRLVDVTVINFVIGEKDIYQYTIELKTYWLK